MMKNFCIALFFFLFAGSLQAQDLHFSQFYMSPLHTNPALTGVMNCSHRVTTNYRNQWGRILKFPYNTIAAAYDQKIGVGRYDNFGIGVSFWADVAGETRFQLLQPKLSASYSKRMWGGRNSSHYLVLGTDVGLSQRSVNVSAFRFGNQFQNGEFNPSLPSGEILDGVKPFYHEDVSVGLLWFSVLDDETNFYAGASMAHLTRPNVSFLNNSFKLYNRNTFHAGGEFPISKSTRMIPGAVVMFQGPSFETNLGTSFRFVLSDKSYDYQAFEVGLWSRFVKLYSSEVTDTGTNTTTSYTSDAIILSSRFEYGKFGIGFSYDWNVSPLRGATRGNGAFEFSLRYTVCQERGKELYCPNF